MDIAELEMRLAALEQAKKQSDQGAMLDGFMDKYGTRFNGNRGLGLTVLNELSRRGVDVSAADDAVQKITDELRMEATALLDNLKEAQAQVSEAQAQVSAFTDKVNTVDEAVMSAQGGAPMEEPAPDMSAEAPAPMEEPAPMPEEQAPMEEPAPDMSAEEPASDMSAEEPAPDMSAEEPAPEADMGNLPPPEQAFPDANVLSDENMKNIVKEPMTNAMLSDRRMKLIKQFRSTPKPKSGSTFSSSLLNAAKRGF